MPLRRQQLIHTMGLILVASATVAQPVEDEEANRRCMASLGEGTSYVFVVDASSSMKEDDRLIAVKKSARGLVRTMREEDEVALFKFYSCQVERLLEFTHDKERFLEELQTINPGGSTPLAMGIEHGGNYLLTQAANSRMSLIVLTDGEENCDGNPAIATARFREQLALAEAAAADPDEPPEIETITFVDESGEPLDEVHSGDEFKLKVVMSATPTRCVDKEWVELEFNNGESDEPQSLRVEVIETGEHTKTFESKMITL